MLDPRGDFDRPSPRKFVSAAVVILLLNLLVWGLLIAAIAYAVKWVLS